MKRLGLIALFAIVICGQAIAQTGPGNSTMLPASKAPSNWLLVPNGLGTGVDGYVAPSGTSNGYLNVNGSGGGGGGGGAVTAVSGAFVDGSISTIGTKGDAAWSGTGSASEIAINKAIYTALVSPIPAGTNTIGVVNLGTLNGAATSANLTNLTQTVAPGTVALNSILNGCIFNTTLPTVTNGQGVAEQCDANGRLILGTSAAVIGAVTQSGTWAANIKGNAGVAFDAANTGATIPTNAIATGAQYGSGNPGITTATFEIPRIDTSASLYTDGEIRQNAYSSAFSLTPTVGVIAQICGNAGANDHIRVREVDLSGTAATAANMGITMTMTSAAATGGTGTAQGISKMDSNDGASGATVTAYSAAATVGTNTGNLYITSQDFSAAGASVDRVVKIFGAPNNAASVLIGVAQCLDISASGTAPTTPVEYVTFQWTEDATN
jgi:hypothetical protein